ncbi:MAG: hypothetical protein HQK76_12995 [Desulfobacterales bacterium]|nr:hypothetical protein [Desulfobacterales bacterium]
MVIIYSSDKIRGGILTKVLNREQIDTSLINTIFALRDSLQKHIPKLIIIDIKNSLSNEITTLKNLAYSLKESFIIILGESSTSTSFFNDIAAQCLDNCVSISDPLAPDMIVSKIKEAFSSKRKNTQSNNLEKNLKEFLRLI